MPTAPWETPRSDDELVALAQQIRLLLDRAGMTPRQFAEKPDVPYTSKEVYQFLSGTTLPPSLFIDLVSRDCGDLGGLIHTYEQLRTSRAYRSAITRGKGARRAPRRRWPWAWWRQRSAAPPVATPAEAACAASTAPDAPPGLDDPAIPAGDGDATAPGRAPARSGLLVAGLGTGMAVVIGLTILLGSDTAPPPTAPVRNGPAPVASGPQPPASPPDVFAEVPSTSRDVSPKKRPEPPPPPAPTPVRPAVTPTPDDEREEFARCTRQGRRQFCITRTGDLVIIREDGRRFFIDRTP